MEEEWRLIKNSDGYYVSNLGRVKRIYRVSGKEKILKLQKVKTSKETRLSINIMFIEGDNRHYKLTEVGRLVAEEFLNYNNTLQKLVYKNNNCEDLRVSNILVIDKKSPKSNNVVGNNKNYNITTLQMEREHRNTALINKYNKLYEEAKKKALEQGLNEFQYMDITVRLLK